MGCTPENPNWRSDELEQRGLPVTCAAAHILASKPNSSNDTLQENSDQVGGVSPNSERNIEGALPHTPLYRSRACQTREGLCSTVHISVVISHQPLLSHDEAPAATLQP